MKKKSTRRRRQSSPAAAVPIDAHLTALLGFLDGVAPDEEHNPSHLALKALADNILADVPASLAGVADHPSVFDSVTDHALEAFREEGKDRGAEATVLDEILSYGAKPITITDTTPAFSVLVRCVNDAALVGACLMYGLLKGGAR